MYTHITRGIVSNKVSEVEAILGDGSCDPGETVDEIWGFSSIIGDAGSN